MLCVLPFPALCFVQRPLISECIASVSEGAGSRFFSALACDLTSSRGSCWTVGHPYCCSPALLAGLPTLWKSGWGPGVRARVSGKPITDRMGSGRSGPQGGRRPGFQEAVQNLLLDVCDFKRDSDPLMEGTGGACNIFSQLRQKQKCLFLRPDLKFR